MTHKPAYPMNNKGSNADSELRRTGCSSNDPHGGHSSSPHNRPHPDPISKLATIDDGGAGGAPDRPHLANQPGNKPGFGPNQTAEKLEANPELGIDPREAAQRTGDGQ